MERNLIDNYVHLHSSGGDYGSGADQHLPAVLPHLVALKPQSLIDYGAGRSQMAELLGEAAGIRDVHAFDPAVPDRATLPSRKFSVLVSFDVLEHVPEAEMDFVLNEMSVLAPHALHVIDTRIAKTVLADGRNAHVSRHDENWWLDRLSRFWPASVAFPMKKGRVGIKSWTNSLPSWRHNAIFYREKFKLKLHKHVAARNK